MASNNSHVDESVATYLRSKGYIETLRTFLNESPNLCGRTVNDFVGDISNKDGESLAQDLRLESGAYSVLTQAVSQAEHALATMKYGLRLACRRPNGTVSLQSRFYRSHSTIRRPVDFEERRNQRRQQQQQPNAPTNFASSSAETSTTQTARIQDQTSHNQEPATPSSQQLEERRRHIAEHVQPAIDCMNSVTPTRRQLFSSPSKRKTPNPKHQLTPVTERDLLEEALKQCSISPSNWERRISDSAVPIQLAAAINTALTNSSTPSRNDNVVQPQVSGHDDDGEDVVISETLYQIGTNRDFFESLEQLFAPEYNDPDASAVEEEVNRVNGFHTPESSYIFNSSGTPALEMAFNDSGASSTTARTGFTPPRLVNDRSPLFRRLLPKPQKRNAESPEKVGSFASNRVVARPLPCGTSQPDSSEASPLRKSHRRLDATDSNHNAALGKKRTVFLSKGADFAGDEPGLSGRATSRNSYPSTDLLTPDRIDALMMRLHRRK